MKWLKALILLAVSGGLFFALNTKFGQLPPLGAFLNPFSGFWQNNAQLDDFPETLSLDGLRDSVTVAWDKRAVPHIFAQNLHDLYFAQGYLTARHRLWQMEFQTHAAAGRLSEIVGAQAIEFDRFRRRIGMPLAAERAEKHMLSNPETALAITAYADGVNAWIDQLDNARLPVEYKLLDYTPERWSTYKTALFISYFAYTLTFRNNDADMTRIRSALGDTLFQQLYPTLPPLAEPIVPSGTHSTPRTTPLPSATEATRSPLGTSQDDEPYIFGSNNWAVSGNLTASGKPILCNDPHLALNLPSIWYETQLVCPPERLNVYGVSAPGVPSVLIGFNENIAWGVTNGTSDAIDWLAIDFTGDGYKTYRYNGGIRQTTTRVETINVRGAASVIDSIIETHAGNVCYRDNETPFDESVPKNTAILWTAHRAGNELLTFLKLARAKNYDEYVNALSSYNSPAQNFVFACNNGDIAIWHNGLFPKRQKYQGAFILNGRDSLDGWREFISRPELPHVKNPSRGFVSSANQQAVDDAYPYYLGWDYAPFERSSRINARLAELASTKKITADDMMSLQTDALNPLAQLILPTLLKTLDTTSLSGDSRKAFDELARWNYRHQPDAIAPTIFERWWSNLQRALWEKTLPHSAPYPSRNVTAAAILTQDSASRSFFSTAQLSVSIQQSFASAVDTLVARYGSLRDTWAWKETRKTTVQHLARLAPFSREKLHTSGNYNCVNATGTTSGPSWRMVVELGDTVKAWGIYPGGQSGDAGSRFYDQMVGDWIDGKYHRLLFLTSPAQPVSYAPTSIIGQTRLNPATATPTWQRFFGAFPLQKLGRLWQYTSQPWWSFAIALPFIVGLLRKPNAASDANVFFQYATFFGALWLCSVLFIVLFRDGGVISAKVAALMTVGSPYLLVLLTSAVMALVAGVASLTGVALRRSMMTQKGITAS
jgi:penicillin amidase